MDEIRERLDRDYKEIEKYQAVVTETRQLWDRFVQNFTVLAVQSHYRPTLMNLDRFHLNEYQERFVGSTTRGLTEFKGRLALVRPLSSYTAPFGLRTNSPTGRYGCSPSTGHLQTCSAPP